MNRLLDFIYFISFGVIMTHHQNGWTLVYFDINKDGEKVIKLFEFKD